METHALAFLPINISAIDSLPFHHEGPILRKSIRPNFLGRPIVSEENVL